MQAIDEILNGYCSKPQQYKMAKYCEEIIGEYLLKRPLDNVPVSTILAFTLLPFLLLYIMVLCLDDQTRLSSYYIQLLALYFYVGSQLRGQFSCR